MCKRVVIVFPRHGNQACVLCLIWQVLDGPLMVAEPVMDAHGSGPEGLRVYKGYMRSTCDKAGTVFFIAIVVTNKAACRYPPVLCGSSGPLPQLLSGGGWTHTGWPSVVRGPGQP